MGYDADFVESEHPRDDDGKFGGGAGSKSLGAAKSWDCLLYTSGVGAGLTGRPVDVGIVDDPTKGESEALSETVKESQWNWYQAVFSTRLSQNSGQIVMATSWAMDDLPGRILSLIHISSFPPLIVM